MGYRDVILEREDGVATLTLNRPQTLNALTSRMMAEIAQAANEVKEDDQLKVLIVTGADRGFCSGADLSPRRPGEEEPLPFRRRLHLAPFQYFGSMILAIADVQKPTIAAVNGPAVGAGLSLAMACDMRIAAASARFSAIFVRRGLMPDAGSTYFLPRLVGTPRACELLYTGDIIEAAEADRIGLVNHVVPDDGVMAAAKELANKIATGPSLAIEYARQAIYHSLSNDLPTQIGFETYGVRLCGESEDAREGRLAFQQKRPPVFKGR